MHVCLRNEWRRGWVETFPKWEVILIQLNQHTPQQPWECTAAAKRIIKTRNFVRIKAQLSGCKTMAAPKHDGCIQSVLIYKGVPALKKRATMQKQT